MMKIKFIFAGGKYVNEAKPLAESYLVRVERYFPIEQSLVSVNEKEEQRQRAIESQKILGQVSESDYVLLFDERGLRLSSTQLSEMLSKQIEQGSKRVVSIVGGAYGVSDEVRERADVVISFSSMVFPHQLARIMAIEQIYRALAIRDGSKYHHQ